MKSFEASIKTKFGELKISFDTKEELEKKLKDAEEFIKTLNSQARAFAITEMQKLAGLGDILMVNTMDGSVKLLRTPDPEGKRVALVVYGYYCISPNGGTIDQISKSSGVKEVSRRVLTSSVYRKFFMKTGKETYTLSQEGLKWVTEDIVPELRSKEIQKIPERSETAG